MILYSLSAATQRHNPQICHPATCHLLQMVLMGVHHVSSQGVLMSECTRTQNASHQPATRVFHHVTLQSNSVVKTSVAYFTLVKVDTLVNLQVLFHVAQANGFPTDATWGGILASRQGWNVLEHAQM